MKIVITTGFSGGHIYPALSFGEHFKRDHDSVEIKSLFSSNLPKGANA